VDLNHSAASVICNGLCRNRHKHVRPHCASGPEFHTECSHTVCGHACHLNFIAARAAVVPSPDITYVLVSAVCEVSGVQVAA